MCVLTAGYSKELCLLPMLAVVAFPDADSVAAGFAAFVLIGVFKLVYGLVNRREV
jgi:hypothetical protein